MNNPAQDSIGDLFHQLVDDGRNVVKAEVDLYKQIGLYRFGKAKSGFIAFAAGGLLAFSALIAFMVSLVMGLDPLIGPVAGGLVVLAASGLIAYLLFRYGAAKMAALSGDPQEKAALAAGERQA